MATVVYCRACKIGYALVGKLPSLCPSCGVPAHWVTNLDPTWPFELSYNDKRLLRSLKIATDE